MRTLSIRLTEQICGELLRTVSTELDAFFDDYSECIVDKI